MTKLAREWIQWCPNTFQSIMFCVPICYWIMKGEEIWRAVTWPVVAYGQWNFKYVLSHWERNTGWERQSRELKNVFGPKWDSSPNIVRVIKSRRMRWAVHVERIGEETGVYRVLVEKPEGRRPLGRSRRRRVDNISMDLHEVGCGYMDWIGLAQDRDRWRTLVSTVMNLRVPWNVGNYLTSCKPVSFSRRTLHHGVSK